MSSWTSFLGVSKRSSFRSMSSVRPRFGPVSSSEKKPAESNHRPDVRTHFDGEKKVTKYILCSTGILNGKNKNHHHPAIYRDTNLKKK